MPLFHIHGLMAGLLAPLYAGGSVFCTPGFNALRFFAWMEEAKPTWYTAVPTMHQAILARASHNRDIIARHPLRFLRSSSASMPPQVIAELEATFDAPLIEAYGMTEAAHQMASNPLAGRRKPGSVGLAAGPEIAIMDEAGHLLPAGATGEIVIRGDNVTAGYENNAKANAEAFTDGWFRTGDQGIMDDDGYLRLTGRLKEIINRGGEKISPREVDEILMDHPAVRRSSPSRCRTTSSARMSRPPSCCATAMRRARRNCALSSNATSPPSKCRARSSFSTRSRRARPASCSASALPRNSGWRERVAFSRLRDKVPGGAGRMRACG